jgi:hypothetical protein
MRGQGRAGGGRDERWARLLGLEPHGKLDIPARAVGCSVCLAQVEHPTAVLQ